MKYRQVWIALVRVVPEEGYVFRDLVDLEDAIDETDGRFTSNDFKGAWANVFAIAADIREALDIIESGLKEKHFVADVIDSIENTQSLMDNDDLSEESVKDLNWLLDTNFRFMITGRLFPFDETEFTDNS